MDPAGARRAGLAMFAALSLGIAACRPPVSSTPPLPAASARPCSGSTHASTRWSLYFGAATPKGVVSDREWEDFLRDEVTPRFPSGFSIQEATGQWRGADSTIVKERTRILVLIQPETRGIHFAVDEIINRYKTLFQQEAVLQELSPVCAGL